MHQPLLPWLRIQYGQLPHDPIMPHCHHGLYPQTVSPIKLLLPKVASVRVLKQQEEQQIALLHEMHPFFQLASIISPTVCWEPVLGTCEHAKERNC